MSTLCQSTQKQISDFLDGTLSANRSWSVKMHLSTCPDCAALESSLRKTVSALQNSRTRSLPNSFDRGLALKLEAARQNAVLRPSVIDRIKALTFESGARWSYRKRWAVAIAGVGAAACLAALPLLSSDHDPAITPATQAVSASDMAFVAACSSDNARYQSSQPLADPMAQTLAARADATGVRPNTAASNTDGY